MRATLICFLLLLPLPFHSFASNPLDSGTLRGFVLDTETGTEH